MGTRGFIGFVSGGKEAVAYCHFDAYPSGLGLDMLGWLLTLGKTGLDQAALDAAALRAVTDSDEPTDEDIARLRRWTDLSVGGASERPTWYQLLRQTQGDAGAILEAGVIEDASDFPADSLFAEWGYVVDFDNSVFEVYEGFQKVPHSDGRFAGMTPSEGGEYFPVRLIRSWPLSGLPTGDAFMASVDPEDLG